ncbi:hypothetical protein D9611_013936 [Ephemerocybe angulata]|uniref:ATP-dependent DNA helicase n=1 Tax=Ephemerocybe angulata TaxID=980116 RepID=A0A8H5B7V0_9AGAR|nr:hypothetical protein D9611_013936 [Tulosesus angulatus]
MDVDPKDEEIGTWSQKKVDQMKEVEVVLHSAGWHVDGASSTASMAGRAFAPERSFAPSKWKDVVASERRKVMNARLATAVPNQYALEDDMDIDVQVINDARVVPGSYFHADFNLNDADVSAQLNETVQLYSLNEEQTRAFRIVANHSVSPRADQLLMYIGGMGGTGKTQVINALRLWFDVRNQGNRMVVTAPTGAAASVVRGSTYHSYLGVATGDRRAYAPRGGKALDEARLRMRGVDYVFMDEISMVSCQDLYLIDARLKDITTLHDLPFGGVNIIVAGDFAQLPPAKGLSLYSGEVSKVQLPRQVQGDQDNTLGLLLWNMFVTVVVLRQNMRQTESDDADEDALRTCLVNMRYRECTEADLEFLRSRIPANNPSISLGDPLWRNVSIITAWNTHKDQINEMNAVRFAHESKQPLFMFYCIDKQSTANGQRGRRKKAPPPPAQHKIKLTDTVREALWTSPPYTSEHVPACLPLCVGMPVMIRNNDATELCITKGQEAKVRGWTSREISGHPGKFALDVLFVELLNPKDPIKLPYLEENVVPLMKISTAITAVLPNDAKISVSRQQVPVILNFAMTDYASQGKTREVNVVDLTRSRNHQAMYTALSRGTKASATAILRDFKEEKLTGGISGHLRQEFRMIDTLDEITKRRYDREIPAEVVQKLRASTVVAYKTWKRKEGSAGESEASKRNRKRKADHIALVESAKKKIRVDPEIPRESRQEEFREKWLDSWEWDSVDWSCAHDSFLTILRYVWYTRSTTFISQLAPASWYLEYMFEMFAAIDRGAAALNECRYGIRERLWLAEGDSFPRGQAGTDLYSLVQIIGGSQLGSPSNLTYRLCMGCHARTPGTGVFEGIGPYVDMRSSLSRVVQVSTYVRSLEAVAGSCSDCDGDLLLENEYPQLMLAGVVYWGADHFAARIVDESLRVYRYDDMQMNGLVTYEYSLSSGLHKNTLSVFDRKGRGSTDLPLNQLYSLFKARAGSGIRSVWGNVLVVKADKDGIVCDVVVEDLYFVETLVYSFFEDKRLYDVPRGINPLVSPDSVGSGWGSSWA